jgi:hypothetical protein
MREKIYEIVERYEEEGDLECTEEIRQLLKDNGITQYEVSIDEMFDSCGYDVWAVSVAWIENGKLELAVSSIGIA